MGSHKRKITFLARNIFSISRQKIEKNFVDKINRKWSVFMTFTKIWYSHFPILYVVCLCGIEFVHSENKLNREMWKFECTDLRKN